MAQQTIYFPLGGGMDLVTPAVAVPPGRVIASLNYEPVATGYRRMRGFERFDGRAAPSEGGVRGDIQAVPGAGPVRGIHMLNGAVLAARDNASAVGKLYVSSSTGWQEVALTRTINFSDGGPTEIRTRVFGAATFSRTRLQGALSGALGYIRDVNLTGGAWADLDAAGNFVIAIISGTFQNGELVHYQKQEADGSWTNVQTSAATVSGPGTTTPISGVGTYHFLSHNFYGASDLTRLYFVNGTGKAMEYDPVTTTLAPIVTGMSIDKPNRLAEHKGSLFLSFPGGSIQFSTVGDPLDFSPIVGAGEIAIGDEVTDFINLPNALGILGSCSIHVLYGNDSADYTLETLTKEAGALSHTAQRLGSVLYMDNRGIRTLDASRAYGNFSMATISRLVAPLVEDKRRDNIFPSASLVARAQDQYWLFFDDGTGLIVYMGGKQPSILPFNLGVTITCAVSVEDDGVERLFVGADNGFVYELNKGTSFDGDNIEHYIRLPFNHFGTPTLYKVAKKVLIDIEASGTTTLSVSAEYDYGAVPGSSTVATTVETGGGAIDDLGSNELYFASQIETQAEAYLDGICRNISLKIGGSTSTEQPHTLTGVTYHVLPRRQDL